MGLVKDESGTGGAEGRTKVESGRKVAGADRSLVNAKDLQRYSKTHACPYFNIWK